MPDTFRRRERGQRNGSGAFGHGRDPDRSSLPRRTTLLPFLDHTRTPLPDSADGLPPLDDRFWRTLDDGLSTLRLTLTAGARAAIDAHVRLLEAWNAQINLTALRTPEQVARGHVLDSLLAVVTLRRLASAGRGRGGPITMIDLGSGGGFPGLPLAAVLPVSRALLVDSVGKKGRFLAVAAAAASRSLQEAGETAPELGAAAERAEDLADEPEHRGGWDVVLARAIGSVAEVVELGLPLCRPGGHVVAWKIDSAGGSLQRELGQAARVTQAAGGGRLRIESLAHAADVGLAGHCLVVVEKRRPTPDRYPRPAAERRRSPLLP